MLTLQGCCGDREKVCKVLSTEASSAQQTTVINSSFSFFSFFSSSSLLPAPFLLSFAPSSFSHLPPPIPQHQPPARPAPAGAVQPPGIQGPADLWCAGRVQNEVMKGLFIHTASFTKDYWKFPCSRMSETCLFTLTELSSRFYQIDPQEQSFLPVQSAFCHKFLTDQYLKFCFRSSHHGAAEMNLTRNPEVAGSIHGLAQWVKDRALS